MDLIDREAVIDDIKAMYEWHDVVTEDRLIEHMKRLPAAVSDFITCADCRYAGKQITDGRYWCNYHDGYMRYCGDAERRQ